MFTNKLFVLFLISLFEFLVINQKCYKSFQCSSESSQVCGQYILDSISQAASIRIFYSCGATFFCDVKNQICKDNSLLTYLNLPGDLPLSTTTCKFQSTDYAGFCTGSYEKSSCTSSQECKPRLDCTSTTIGKVCYKMRELWETCDNNLNSCSPYLQCVDNKCQNYSSADTLFRVYFPSCTSIATGFCVSNGALISTPSSFEGYCLYDNGDKVSPDCSANGSIICNYGLKDVPFISSNFKNYLATLPECSITWPICQKGNNISYTEIYNLTVNQFGLLFRIKERVLSVKDCIYDYTKILRNIGSDNKNTRLLTLENLNIVSLNIIMPSLIENLLILNPFFLKNGPSSSRSIEYFSTIKQFLFCLLLTIAVLL